MAENFLNKVTKAVSDILNEKNFYVDKIVVFGSAAAGADIINDLDIIIISSEFEGKDIFERVKMLRGLHTKLVEIFEKSVDLLYYSLNEWENDESIIINDAKQTGFVYNTN